MIVKVETKQGWIFFDYVEHFEVYEQQRNEDSSSDCPTQCLLMNENAKFIKILYLAREKQDNWRLKVDDNQVYLINDIGKTIERIN